MEEQKKLRTWDLKSNPATCEKLMAVYDEYSKEAEELTKLKHQMDFHESRLERLKRRFWDEILDVYPDIEGTDSEFNKEQFAVIETVGDPSVGSPVKDILRKLFGM